MGGNRPQQYSGNSNNNRSFPAAHVHNFFVRSQPVP